jgi:hypothetical protein
MTDAEETQEVTAWQVFETSKLETTHSKSVTPFRVDSSVPLKRPITRATQTISKIIVNTSV